jgi:hypothetical protein
MIGYLTSDSEGKAFTAVRLKARKKKLQVGWPGEEGQEAKHESDTTS